MKKIVLSFLVFLSSCLDDSDTLRKETLFAFYDEMKMEIIKENLDWIGKNFSEAENIESLKGILVENMDSIKNLMSSEDGEYSVTINYITGSSVDSYRGSYIVRNTKYSPTYYYIRLLNENPTKWKIESIDKLPVNTN